MSTTGHQKTPGRLSFAFNEINQLKLKDIGSFETKVICFFISTLGFFVTQSKCAYGCDDCGVDYDDHC